MRRSPIVGLIALALLVGACEKDKKTEDAAGPAEKSVTETPAEPAAGTPGGPGELVVDVIEEGDGKQAALGDVLAVHYKGMLLDGTVFDSSRERGEPIRFLLGQGRVIPGWEMGLKGHAPGAKLKLTIPPELAYGARQAGPIPPNSTLIFETEIVGVSPTGLKIEDVEEGSGDAANPGDRVRVHYTGTLEDGTVFDSSHPRGRPFTFVLGAGQVISGWDVGVRGMKEGGKRRLTIPPELGYGSRGSPPKIPPNATLIFDVELLEILK